MGRKHTDNKKSKHHNKHLKGYFKELDPRRDPELTEEDTIQEIKRSGKLPKEDDNAGR